MLCEIFRFLPASLSRNLDLAGNTRKGRGLLCGAVGTAWKDLGISGRVRPVLPDGGSPEGSGLPSAGAPGGSSSSPAAPYGLPAVRRAGDGRSAVAPFCRKTEKNFCGFTTRACPAFRRRCPCTRGFAPAFWTRGRIFCPQGRSASGNWPGEWGYAPVPGLLPPGGRASCGGGSHFGDTGETVELQVAESNLRARALYEKLGFLTVGAGECWWEI